MEAKKMFNMDEEFEYLGRIRNKMESMFPENDMGNINKENVETESKPETETQDLINNPESLFW
jgi:hypothetical protein